MRVSPDDKVEGFEAELGRSRVDRWLASPVNEGAENAAITEKGPCGCNPGLVESEELGIGHFTRRHDELAVLAARDMAGYRNVVRLVRQKKPGRGIAIHQTSEDLWICGVAANEPVRTKLKDVTNSGDGEGAVLRLKRS